MSDISMTKGISSSMSSEISTIAYKLASDIQAANGYTDSLEDIYKSIESAISNNSDDLVKYGIQASDEYVKAFVRKTKGVDLFNVDVSESTMQIETLNAVLYQSQRYSDAYKKSIGSIGYEMQKLDDESAKLKANTAELFEPLLKSLLKLFNSVISGVNDMLDGLNTFIDMSSNFLSGNGFVESQIKTEKALGTATDAINNQTQALIKEGEQAEKLKQKLLGFDKVNVLGGLYDNDPDVNDYSGGIGGVNNGGTGGTSTGGFKGGDGISPIGGGPKINYKIEMSGIDEFNLAYETVKGKIADLQANPNIIYDALLNNSDFVANFNIVKRAIEYLTLVNIPGIQVYLMGRELIESNIEAIKEKLADLAQYKVDVPLTMYAAAPITAGLYAIKSLMSSLATSRVDIPLTCMSAPSIIKSLTSIVSLLDAIRNMDIQSTLSKKMQGVKASFTDTMYGALNAFNKAAPYLENAGKVMVVGSAATLGGMGVSAYAPAIGGAAAKVSSYAAGLGGFMSAIPAHADGGITTRASLGLIGEAGSEAVIPLTSSRGRAAMKQIADAASGSDSRNNSSVNKNYHININAGTIIEDEYTVREFCSKIRDTLADIDNSDGDISVGLGV